MRHLMHDLSFAWTQSLKHRATSLLIILTLALGIGANSAMFSVVYHVSMAPLPYVDGQQLVRLEQSGLNYYPTDAPWSDATLHDYRQQNTVFSALAEYTQGIYTVVSRDAPWQANAGFTASNYFEMLGVRPLLGRSFNSADEVDGAEAVMLLSYDTWRGRFGADPAVVGQVFEMSRILYRVIGVLPELPAYPHANDLWVPTVHDPFRVHGYTDAASNRASGYVLNVFGKLQADTSLATAAAEMDAIAQRLAQAWPDVYGSDYSLTLKPLRNEMAGTSASMFLLLFMLAFIVMMIACANVANLLLARMLARNQELAIREAIGASPGRIRRQVLTESMLFAVTGGVLALCIAQPCMELLADYVARYTPLAQTIRLDMPMLLFTLAAALATGWIGGMLALVKRSGINAALKEGGDKATTSSAGTWRRQVLLLTQFALAFVVLTTSALIAFSLYQLNLQDAGYHYDGVLELSALMNLDLAAPSAERQAYLRSFGEQLRARTEALPGVEASGFFGGAPLLQDVAWLRPTLFELEDPSDAAPPQELSTRINFVSTDWFNVMDIALLQGRQFVDGDDGGTAVAIVNASLAQRFFPEGDISRKIIRYAGTDFELPIVGVVENFRSRNLAMEDEPAVYIHRNFPTDALNYYVRSSGDLDELAESITAIVRELDPRQSIMRITSLEDVRNEWLGPTRLRTLLICLFGALALVVTLAGVVGVVAYNVRQHVREIGIHMAVGASPRKITRLFVLQGLRTYACGLALGLALTVSVASLLQPLLYDTCAFSPGVYAVVILALTLVVLLATYLPARKAGQLTPMEALHAQ